MSKAQTGWTVDETPWATTHARRNLAHGVRDAEGLPRAAFYVLGDAERYCRDRNRQAGIGEVGDAHAEVREAAESRIATLRDLQRIAAGIGIDEYSNDEILRLDLAYGIPGPIEASQLEEEAAERLDEYPLAVERTTTFEVVLSTGGPDQRLCFECEPVSDKEGWHGADIRRVYFRHSWTGSAEIELSGEDRKVAEELARRVVPELAE